MNRIELRIRWLHIGILVIAVVAALTRLPGLSKRPIDNSEAISALNAAQLTTDPAPYWLDQTQARSVSPLYEWLTAAVFQVSGSGEGAARLFPAIAGILFVLLPLGFLRAEAKATLLLGALFLALSPVAISLSRAAGGTMLSALLLCAFVLTMTLSRDQDSADRSAILAAILIGGALSAGEPAFHGLFSLIIAGVLVRWLYPEIWRFYSASRVFEQLLKYLWLSPIVAILLATGMGMSRLGLSGIGESFVTWLNGWIPFGQLSALGFLAAGISYEPLLFILGAAGIILVRKRADDFAKLSISWALGALLSGLIYPGRSAQELLWVLIPSSFLAALFTSELITRLTQRVDWPHVFSLVAISLVLISSAVVTIIGYVNGYLQQMLVGDDVLIGVALFAMFLLLSSVIVLFGLGWSWDVVWDGLGIVLILMTLALSISSAWKLEHDRQLGFRTLWESDSPSANGRYFDNTIENASLALTGSLTAAPVHIDGEPNPSLIWHVRHHPRYFNPDPTLQAAPPIIIARAEAGLGEYGAEYFGQKITMTFERAWYGLLPPDFFRWSVTNSAPTAPTGWVVFVRSDIIALSDFAPEAPSELTDE